MGRTSDAKERLIQAAMDLFLTRSYTDVGVQELCKAASVKKGSFYHFFETKQDLVLAALDRWWEITRKTAWERAFSSERPPLERISRFFELVYEQNCQFYEQHKQLCGCPFGNLAVEMSAHEPLIRHKIDRIFEDVIGRLQRTLDDEAVEASDLSPMDHAGNSSGIVGVLRRHFDTGQSAARPGSVKTTGTARCAIFTSVAELDMRFVPGSHRQ